MCFISLFYWVIYYGTLALQVIFLNDRHSFKMCMVCHCCKIVITVDCNTHHNKNVVIPPPRSNLGFCSRHTCVLWLVLGFNRMLSESITRHRHTSAILILSILTWQITITKLLRYRLYNKWHMELAVIQAFCLPLLMSYYFLCNHIEKNLYM